MTTTSSSPKRSLGDDRAEIQNLSNRLMIAADAMDGATYAACFAKGGILHWVYGVEHGRAAIAKAITNWRLETDFPPEATSRPRTRHMILNQVIDVDGDTGSGIAYWMALTNKTPQKDVQLLYFGHVEESYVFEDGKWLFAERRVYNESLHNRAMFYPALGERDPR